MYFSWKCTVKSWLTTAERGWPCLCMNARPFITWIVMFLTVDSGNSFPLSTANTHTHTHTHTLTRFSDPNSVYLVAHSTRRFWFQLITKVPRIPIAFGKRCKRCYRLYVNTLTFSDVSGGNSWRHYFLNNEFEITVVLDDRNVELRIRVSVSMPGKNFTVWNPVFCILLEITYYRYLWRMVYIGVRGYLVTVIVSELSVSGSETYLVIAYTKLSLCLTFFSYSDKSHIAWFHVTVNWYAKK